jgi:hypothetical protein
VKAQHRHWIQQSMARAFDPPLRADALCLSLTQGCAPLALGYFRWLPTGAVRCADHGMANVEVHLELLARLALPGRRSVEVQMMRNTQRLKPFAFDEGCWRMVQEHLAQTIAHGRRLTAQAIGKDGCPVSYNCTTSMVWHPMPTGNRRTFQRLCPGEIMCCE